MPQSLTTLSLRKGTLTRGELAGSQFIPGSRISFPVRVPQNTRFIGPVISSQPFDFAGLFDARSMRKQKFPGIFPAKPGNARLSSAAARPCC